jgi:hypothetical protein
MDVQGWDRAPFSARVRQEIESTVIAARNANSTARAFLEVDGPWGTGLTSISGEERRLTPNYQDAAGVTVGGQHHAWGVPRALPLDADANYDPDHSTRRGTTVMVSAARPVPAIHSEFLLGVRNVEAFDDECQPLDLGPAMRAARDVALEEERLIYYGNQGAGQPGLLSLHRNRLFLRQLLLRVAPGVMPLADPSSLQHGLDDLPPIDLPRYIYATPLPDLAAVRETFAPHTPKSTSSPLEGTRRCFSEKRALPFMHSPRAGSPAPMPWRWLLPRIRPCFASLSERSCSWSCCEGFSRWGSSWCP